MPKDKKKPVQARLDALETEMRHEVWRRQQINDKLVDLMRIARGLEESLEFLQKTEFERLERSWSVRFKHVLYVVRRAIGV